MSNSHLNNCSLHVQAAPTGSGYPRPFHKAEVSAPDSAKDFDEQRNTHMSPHAVNSLVTDLVQMAQAMEKVPQLEAELFQSRQEIAGIIISKALIEADLEQSRSYAASLEAKVRELEVAKDAAETMFLEADDRTTRALEFVKTMFGSAGSLIQALEPPRPEPVVSEVKPIDPNEGHAVLSDGTTRYGIPALVDSEGAKTEPPPGGYYPPQGQSAADPIPHTEPSYPNSGGETTGEVGVQQTTSWATPTPPDTKPAQPYAGKSYSEAHSDPGFTWPSQDEWIAGGGTYDNFYL